MKKKPRRKESQKERNKEKNKGDKAGLSLEVANQDLHQDGVAIPT